MTEYSNNINYNSGYSGYVAVLCSRSINKQDNPRLFLCRGSCGTEMGCTCGARN